MLYMETYQITSGPEATAFHAAHYLLEDILADDELAEAWDEQNETTGHPVESAEYWQFVAGAVSAYTHSRDGESLDPLTKDALLLVGHTPAMVHTEIKKRQGWAPVHHARFLLSYGQLLQHAALDHPDLSVTNLQWYLSESSQSVMADDPNRYSNHRHIHKLITGVRSLLATEQALLIREERTGMRYRHASVDEDIHGGFDLVVEPELPDDLYDGDIYLDVKSSIAGIYNGDAPETAGNESFVVKSNGVIALTPGLVVSDFHNRFFIPERLAKQKATELETIFKQVGSQTAAA